MRQVRVEGQEQCGAVLNDADPGMLAAVDTALVPFGLFKPALQVEVVLGQGCLLTANKQPGCKARHHLAHVVPDRIAARVELCLQALKLRLTLGTGATVGVERLLDCPHIIHLSSNGLLDVVHCRQPSCDVAC